MSQHTVLEQVDTEWWKEAVVYQIYPRSFNDSDGDGIGDIPGITEKVGYLDKLGVDVVWLCPIYDSPNADNGYDIRNYRAIMDEFGAMADWETLLTELHARDMRLIMDLVINHTSKEHVWFQQSRQRDGKYEDYYYWRDGTPDTPPNNWNSIFGGPAWTYDEEREQWYLHLFDENQPDLKWRNSDVREDIKEMITWWLEKGIDGFRMDAINFISKTKGLPDGDPDRTLVGLEHYSHGPHIHTYLQEVYDDTLADYDVMTVGEMGETSIDQTAEYLVEGGSGLDMVFQFNHLTVDEGPDGQWTLDGWDEWDLSEFKAIMTRCQNELAGEWWDAVFLGNHDLPRILSRFGDDESYHRESAKLIATFLLTLRGTPYIYQGDEIGMTNAEFESLDEIDDPMTTGIVEMLLAEGRIESYDEAADLVNYRSRDHSRTPMQWSSEANAGFTDSEPWLKLNRNCTDINVASALDDTNSIWQHYKELIDLRHAEDVLVYGEYDLLLTDNEQIYAYRRTLSDETILIVLNWSDRHTTFDCPSINTSSADVLISNYESTSSDPKRHKFQPYEATVYRL
ncbi:glycoside hydrolase family 13 protein [Halegenticoccus tardaugens]|uniref:glycoside hydrolase family 13 protein n=1 Tax=Halegenticoccus tardaugens TaxID=2071624 RepID=UPI00100AFD7E|nr:alpha-glucosidase [Halegenticoccus tardaugens]